MPIKNKSAGPSIRMISISKILNKKYKCKLYSKEIDEDQFKKYNFLSKNFWKDFIKADIIYSQPSRFRYLFLSKLFRKKIIIDLYDPTDIENLEMYKDTNKIKWVLIQKYANLRLKYSIKIGHYFVCATETQRKYWIGYFQSLGKIKQNTYNKNQKLENLIGLLPFGLNIEKPTSTDNPILKLHKNIQKEDKVFLWAGGIWNWFDSINLIKAMSELKGKKNIKLLFLGSPKENQRGNEKLKNAFKTIDLAKKLGVYNHNVFFNEDWIDYDQRHNFLLNSYAGISLHYDNLETEFSYRTRILDYLWCDIPYICSDKDYFADLCKGKKLGMVVECENIDSIKNAIIDLSERKELYNLSKNNIIQARKEFGWENCCKDLNNYIENIDKNLIENNNFIESTIFLILVPLKLIIKIFKRN